MSLTADGDEVVEDGRRWAPRLELGAWRGVNDTRSAARARVAAKIGVGVATLDRLIQPGAIVTGLSARAYRGLLLAIVEMEGEVELRLDARRSVRLRLETRERREEARQAGDAGRDGAPCD